MKNVLKILTLLAVFSFVFTSCGTPPTPPPQEKPAPKAAEEPMEEVKAEPMASKPAAEEPRDVPVKEYIIMQGDTLSEIALKFYETRQKAYYFPIIMSINPGVVKHPDKLTPKVKLLIPDFDLFMQHSPSKMRARPEFEKCIKIYEDEGKSGIVESLSRRLKEF
ncbi:MULTISPECIES: LysM peptidoglycan-binding domain-containing protein [unclassified Treponema]|uniref:LysM peptidoglycan-binding domain-containing protein n=1 Tax=unclassified Treponema TaxID=2638727 RepID=UPI0020A51D5A|nr:MULTISPECIES: peptigoglycan-binding protein LysM [unclassified Treponema]UTC67062.1 peptigoglycan-binding protein LysM [Treponema sp. OMZ 789]UTC69793.1 peptigoglycan-binding protein LysM [Treponema sp. OMZ 790]UTC72507.1 peptigoglycan-binding protein LysM [Treponema sp. OMZ 791]